MRALRIFAEPFGHREQPLEKPRGDLGRSDPVGKALPNPGSLRAEESGGFGCRGRRFRRRSPVKAAR